jgi:O-antigen/teichoic acid export membrane protein
MSASTLSGRIVRSAIGSTLYSVIMNLFIYFGQVIIARELSRTDYASFSVVIAFTSLVGLFADLGWSLIIVKRCAIAEEVYRTTGVDDRGRILGTALTVKGFLASVIALGGYAIAYSLYGSDLALLVLVSSFGYFLSSRFTVFRSVFESQLRADGSYERVVQYSTLDAMCFVLLLAGVALFGLDLEATVLIYALCNLPGFVLLIRYFRRSISTASLSFDRATAIALAKESLPLSLAIGCIAIHNMADTLILRELSNEMEVSAYAASMRLMSALIFLPYVLTGILMPVYAKLAHGGEQERGVAITATAFQYMMLIAGFVGLAVTAVAPYAVTFILGEAYHDASSLVVIVGWIFVPTVFAAFLTELSVATDKQRYFAIYTGVLASLTVLIDLAVSATYGAAGVLIGRLSAIVIGCIVLTILASKHVHLQLLLTQVEWPKYFACLVIAGIVLTSSSSLGAAISVGASLATCVYVAMAFALRLVDLARLRGLLTSLRGGAT